MNTPTKIAVTGIHRLVERERERERERKRERERERTRERDRERETETERDRERERQRERQRQRETETEREREREKDRERDREREGGVSEIDHRGTDMSGSSSIITLVSLSLLTVRCPAGYQQKRCSKMTDVNWGGASETDWTADFLTPH